MLLIYEKIILLLLITSIYLWKALDAATSSADEYSAVGNGINSLQASDAWSPSSNVVKTSGTNTFNLSYNAFTNTSLSALNFPWADVPYIHNLDLSHNLITNVSLECFNLVANVPWALIILDLSYNQITNVGNFPPKMRGIMNKLNLEHNLISQLGTPDPNALSRVTIGGSVPFELNLEYNMITKAPFVNQDLHPDSFINLRNNRISEVGDSSGLYWLKNIYLENNELATLSSTFLSDYFEPTENVYLSNNKFTHIPSVGSESYKIIRIYLDNNNIVSIEPTAFDYYNALQVLDLRNNKIASFPFNNVFDHTKLGDLNSLLLQNNKLTGVSDENSQFNGSRTNSLNMNVKGKSN